MSEHQCIYTLSAVNRFVEDASKEGLRTLLIAMKIVSEEQLIEFEKRC
jgi:hypothetical protein